MGADKVIETTINKDTKTPGGTTGFSTNHGAVQRWTLTASYRAEARKNLQEYLYLNSNSSKHPDLLPSRIRRDIKDVHGVHDTIRTLFVNPFDDMELVSISSGIIPSEKVTYDLLNAKTIGEQELLKFQSERLEKQTINFNEPLKKLKLGTFSSLLKKTVKLKNGRVVQFTSQSDIFGKIALLQQSRDIDLPEVFCYPLGPVPWSLATSSEELIKTNKAALMHHLEKGPTNVERVERPCALVIDGMALVRRVSHAGHTFNSYADEAP